MERREYNADDLRRWCAEFEAKYGTPDKATNFDRHVWNSFRRQLERMDRDG